MTIFARRTWPIAATAAAALLVPSASALPSARAADWPLLRGDVQRSGVATERVQPPLSLLWRYTGAAQRLNPCAPAIVGDTVYFATGGSTAGGGVVYALDVKTGAEKWRYPGQGGLGGAVFSTAPMVDGDSVYIGASDNKLYMLNRANGELTRSFTAGGPVGSSPVMYNNVLFFGSDDDTLYAVNPQTGQPAWRQLYRAQDNINSAPVIADNLVFVTSADQYIHAVATATGIPKWRFRMRFQSLRNGLTFADNTLYVPSGSTLYAFQPRSGNQRWALNLPSDISVAPVGEGGVVYVVSNDRKIYALRSNNGREVWEKPADLLYAASAAPTISGDVLYVPTVRNMLYALSRTDGRVLWSYSIEPSRATASAQTASYTTLSVPPAVANGALYVLSDDGSLSAFRPDAPDTTPPLVDTLFPRPGSQVSGSPPLTFTAHLTDPGSGLDQNSVKMTLTGPGGQAQQLDTTYDVSRDLVFYQTSAQAGLVSPPLPNGRHTVTLTARDWRGNAREEKWSFVVDNTLPASVNREPAAPVAPRNPARPGVRPTRPGTTPGGTPRPGQGNRTDRRPNRGNNSRGDGNQGGVPLPPPPPSPEAPPPPPAPLP